jgi:hypothetical protein
MSNCFTAIICTGRNWISIWKSTISNIRKSTLYNPKQNRIRREGLLDERLPDADSGHVAAVASLYAMMKGARAMNTVWLKLAGAIVAIVIILVVVGKFTGGGSSSTPAAPQQTEKAKDVYDSFARDDKKFAVKFQGQDEPEPNTAAPAAAQPSQPPAGQTPAPQPAKQAHFEKLPIEQEVEAQKIYSFALEQRKQSRLPMMSPKMMIDNCRQIISRWPKSEYAFQAKQMLADLPERHKETFKITPQETDVSSFYK